MTLTKLRLVASLAALTAAAPAFGVTLESLRDDAVAGVEAQLTACGVVAADVGGDTTPVPPVAYAERVYTRDGRLVGLYGRSAGGDYERYFAAPNGNVYGTIESGGPDYLSFATLYRGTVSYLNAYATVGSGGQEVRDYNGYCDGSSFSALLGQNLVAAYQRCVDTAFGGDVAAEICRL